MSWGEPLSTSIPKLVLSSTPLLSRISTPIVLDLPMNIKVYCPLNMIVEVWLNELHVFYLMDYEQYSEFKPRRGWVVVDIGAFLGLYTLRAAKLVGSRGLVISVEPLDEVFELLSANVRLNNFDNVNLVKACVASERGERLLYVPSRLVNASLVKEYARLMGGVKKVVRVKAITLRDLLKDLGCIDLLKLDVEGAEVEILTSTYLTPERVRRLIVEVHANVVKPSTVSEMLESKGYDVIVYLPENTTTQVFVYAAHPLLLKS